MTETTRDLVKAFFAALTAGTFTADFFADEIHTQSISSQPNHSAEFYVGGVKATQAQFPGGLHYTIDSIIVEGDSAAAQVRGHGVTADGREYANRYGFFFTFKDGRIATLFEMFDPRPIDELIMPGIREYIARVTAAKP